MGGQLFGCEKLFGGGMHRFKGSGKLRAGNRPAIDFDALSRLDQVRRGVEAGAKPASRRMVEMVAQVEPLPLVPAT